MPVLPDAECFCSPYPHNHSPKQFHASRTRQALDPPMGLLQIPPRRPQAQRQGHLVHHLHHPCHHYRYVRARPTGHDLLHWWNLRAIHSVLDPDHLDLVWPQITWRVQQAELQSQPVPERRPPGPNCHIRLHHAGYGLVRCSDGNRRRVRKKSR